MTARIDTAGQGSSATAATGAAIELEAVGRNYGAVAAVRELSLRVAAGEFLVLVGASGCGKTTTLKMINRLVEPSAGRVTLGGRDTRDLPAAALRRRIGYCFQQIGLFPHLSVAENAAVTPQLLGWPAQRVRQRVAALLHLVELDPDHYGARMPHELSGGQQQRVGIARALAAEPDVLLMDEPFGALDPITRDRLRRRLKEIQGEVGVTTVLVTHDMFEALLLGHRIAVMDAGRLLQVGTPAELLRAPAHGAVRELLESPRRQVAALEELLHPGDPP